MKSLLPAGAPFGAVCLGPSPLLGEFIEADQELLIQREAWGLAILDDFMADSHTLTDKFISEARRGSLQYMTLASFKDYPGATEIIVNKGILFLHIDETVDEFLLSKITSNAQKAGTWTVGITPAGCFTQDISYLSGGLDNIISFNHTNIEKSNIWKASKVIAALWHGCKGGGLICIDASYVEAFLRLGTIGHAGVAVDHGKNCVQNALRNAMYDFEVVSKTAFSSMKGVFVSIEIGLAVLIDHVYDAIRAFFAERCGNTVEFFNDADINTTLNDSAIATIIGII